MSETSLSNKRVIWAVIAVLVLLTVGITVLYLVQRSEMKEIVTGLNEEKESLMGEYEELVQQYDSLIPQNDSILIRLEIEQQKVVQLLEELEIVKATNAAKIREYKKELTTLRSVMKHYVFQIDSLNRVNQDLRDENKKVSDKFVEVSKELTQMEKAKETLAKKVQIASQLEAFDFEISQLNERDRNTRRLSSTAKIEIAFTLSKNITAPVGEKPVYLRITAPNGDVLKKDQHSKFRYQDGEIDYSIMRVIEYQSEEIRVVGYWKIEEYLFEGSYTVDVFTDGFHIGKANFELK
jgi:uncharacterized phage infection (PIP) family protein YhgE